MKILFVCNANVGRSQFAEAFFNKLSKRNIAISAGAKTGEKNGRRLSDCNAPYVIKAMKTAGLDISKKKSKQLTKKIFKSADKVFVMTEKKNLPDYAKRSKKVIFWKVPDAKNAPYSFHVKVRNLIRAKVAKLVKKIG